MKTFRVCVPVILCVLPVQEWHTLWQCQMLGSGAHGRVLQNGAQVRRQHQCLVQRRRQCHGRRAAVRLHIINQASSTYCGQSAKTSRDALINT